MKPVGRAQGKGIFIFQKLSQISKWKSDSRYASSTGGGSGSSAGTSGGGGADLDGAKKTKADSRGGDAEAYIVQRYVANPYLVAGRKFDMRIYALVTTYAPLTVWLYRGGFCRFSSARYSNNAADLENVFMHLTNVAIQKKSADYAKDEHGGKWDVRHLKLYLMSRYGVVMVDRLFNEIQMIVLRSLLAVQQVMIQDKHCFELYGYDVLFDDTFKPWLVEVNASPSLSASTPDDYEMKTTMLSSMLDIIDMEGKLKGDEVRIGGFDLVYRNGHVSGSSGCTYSSMLGASIPAEHTKRRPTPKEGPERGVPQKP
jgi:tubulin polyglutamylase TTLL9